MGRDPRTGRWRFPRQHLRAELLLQAASQGLCSIDAPIPEFADLTGFRGNAEDAAHAGFSGVACIHPRQAEAARVAFTPDIAELARAEEMVAASNGGGGTVSVNWIVSCTTPERVPTWPHVL